MRESQERQMLQNEGKKEEKVNPHGAAEISLIAVVEK